MTEHHDVQVVSGEWDGRRTYRAECSCGYEGRSFDSAYLADNDADEHILAMARIEP